MSHRFYQTLLVLLITALAGCLGGQTGSTPGANPAAAGPGAANPGATDSATPSGGAGDEGGAALPGDGSGGDGGSFYYAADYDATASSAKPLPGGAIGPSGIWEGGDGTTLTAKGTMSQCLKTVYLANGTSNTYVQHRLQGQLKVISPVGEEGPMPNGCSTGMYLHVLEDNSGTWSGCTYFPLTSDCRFNGDIDFVDPDHLKFYGYFTKITLRPDCEPVPLIELGLEMMAHETFYISAKDQISIPRTWGTPLECPASRQ